MGQRYMELLSGFLAEDRAVDAEWRERAHGMEALVAFAAWLDASQRVSEADTTARDDAVRMFTASKDVLAVVIREEHSVIAEVSIVGAHYDDAQMDRLLEIEKRHRAAYPRAWLSFRYLPSGRAA